MRAEDELLFQLARGLGRARLALGEAAARFAALDGPSAFGFSSRDGHARENLSRTGRWVDESARLARRLEKLPRIGAALREGRIDWSMAELLARKATPDTEAKLLALALAPGVTVHAMREYLGCDDDEDKAQRDPTQRRCTLEETAPAEDAVLVEATRMLIEHQLGGRDHDWFEYLLAEGMATEPDLFVVDDLRPIQRELERAQKRIAEGRARRAEAEERAEPDLPENPGPRAPQGRGVQNRETPKACSRRLQKIHRGDFPDPEPLPDDAKALDAVMARLVMQLTSRDLVFGRIASDFFRTSSWKQLGYATDTQYCRERLGMSRGAVWNRITLARRCQKLPALAEALSSMEIGFEAAREIARIATPRTVEAWIARAKERTFKHLREEVRVVDAAVRLRETSGDPWPPTDEEMADEEAFERDMLSGDTIGQTLDRLAAEAEAEAETEAETEAEAEIWIDENGAGATEARATTDDPSDPIQISDTANNADRDLAKLADELARAVHARRRRKSKGEVTLRIRTNEEVAGFYRAARKQYRDEARPSTLLMALCVWYWKTWIHEARAAQTKWHPIHRRDRFRCASPGCDKRLCTLHHVLWRMLGGDDRWINLVSLCSSCHLENVHELRSLRVSGEAPHGLTFVFGQEPFMVVRGRDKRRAA